MAGARWACHRIPGHHARRHRHSVEARVPRAALAPHPVGRVEPTVSVGAVGGGSAPPTGPATATAARNRIGALAERTAAVATAVAVVPWVLIGAQHISLGVVHGGVRKHEQRENQRRASGRRERRRHRVPFARPLLALETRAAVGFVLASCCVSRCVESEASLNLL